MAESTYQVRVGFDHRGDDGSERRAGDEVTVGHDEYLRRGPAGDGFLREVSRPSKDRPGSPGDPVASSLPAGASIPATDPTGVGDSATSEPTDAEPDTVKPARKRTGK